MALFSAVGYAQALDGREAGLQATNQALNRLGSNAATFAMVVAPYRYDPQQVLSGVSSLLGNTPIIGFSATSGFTKDGLFANAVIVALFSSTDLQAEAHWFPAYSQGSEETADKLLQLLGYQQRQAESIIVFGDGFNGDTDQFCAKFATNTPLVGALSSGDPYTTTTYQFAGSQGGPGGLAAAFLRGKIKIGVGTGHGWQPVGPRVRVTRSRGFWLRTLDGRPASETYARLFGYPAREWAFPPLSQMTRLYPLGLDRGTGEQGLLLRSPLRVEADGSFRMNVQLKDGDDAYVLVGVPGECAKAAEKATQEAKLALGKARPVVALVLVDVAWQMLLQAEPGLQITAIQNVLGKDIPIIGGYTLGQIIPGQNDQPPQFLNQHISVILFGEPLE